MIFVLSPAKTMDFGPLPAAVGLDTAPQEPKRLVETGQLVEALQQLSKAALKGLLGVSDALGSLNFARYQAFGTQAKKQAILAYNGPAYVGLSAGSLSKEDLLFANQHVRILSGLYGCLRPLDQIEPYRLDMGTKVKVGVSNDLYQYWGTKIAEDIGEALELDSRNDGAITCGGRMHILVNIASTEYSKAIVKTSLPAGTRIVDVVFQERSGKVVAVHAKRARGLFCRFVIKARIRRIEDLMTFDGEAGEYLYQPPPVSSESTFIFQRCPPTSKSSGLKRVEKRVEKDSSVKGRPKKGKVAS
jgi:cytoplasmic iron level regulating protein YaaA (DUF328/UPF0246 family)